jgi:hypothetical protein
VRSALPTSGYGFNRFTIDARRFNRLSPEIQLNFRVWAGGWVSGDPLPIQRRLSLGGPDLLPGYGFRSLACHPAGFSDPSESALCDRALITQAEFRHRVRLRAGMTVRDPDHRELDRFVGIEDPELVVFGDAGSAWLAGDGPGRVPSDRIRSLSEWKGDAGVGLDAGGIAVYLVKAVTDGQPVRLYLRLERPPAPRRLPSAGRAGHGRGPPRSNPSRHHAGSRRPDKKPARGDALAYGAPSGLAGPVAVPAGDMALA